eukprot:733593-Pelagomonas_calceolata.AAC.3
MARGGGTCEEEEDEGNRQVVSCDSNGCFTAAPQESKGHCFQRHRKAMDTAFRFELQRHKTAMDTVFRFEAQMHAAVCPGVPDFCRTKNQPRMDSCLPQLIADGSASRQAKAPKGIAPPGMVSCTLLTSYKSQVSKFIQNKVVRVRSIKQPGAK